MISKNRLCGRRDIMDSGTAYDVLICGEVKGYEIFDLLDHKSSLPGRTGNILDAERLLNEI